MAKSVNKVMLLGHVGKNPEVGTTPGGKLAVNFSLATTDKESGQKRYWTEIFVHDLTLLGGGRGENGGSAHSNGRDDFRRTAGGSSNQRQGMEGQYADEELNPDEIPF